MRLKNWHTNSIIGFAAAWLSGLWLGHLGWDATTLIFPILIISLVLSWKTRWLVVTITLIGLALGLVYGNHSRSRYQILANLIGQKVTVAGTITDDPTTNEKGTTSFTVSSLTYFGKPIPGEVSVNTYTSKYQRGYQVQLEGKMQSTLGSKQGRMYATVTILSASQSRLERWRQRFIAGINSNLPEPLNGFALGLLIGARSLIPKTLQDQLALIGLSHLVAVSGYNLTIIVEALRRLFTKTSRYTSLVAALWLIGGFVIVAGASASIVRAALVSTFSLWAYYFGRQVKPWVLVAAPAVLTTFWKPEYLWSDVGWQLSFLAFIGILVVAPQLQNRLKRSTWLKKLIIEAICAQVLTFPVILTVFHQFSLVGVIANVLLLPLVPIAMLASLITGVVGTFAPTLAVFAWPAYLILKLMLGIIVQLSRLPWASLNLQTTFPLLGMVYTALLLGVLAIGRHGRTSQIGGGIIRDDSNS